MHSTSQIVKTEGINWQLIYSDVGRNQSTNTPQSDPFGISAIFEASIPVPEGVVAIFAITEPVKDRYQNAMDAMLQLARFEGDE